MFVMVLMIYYHILIILILYLLQKILNFDGDNILIFEERKIYTNAFCVRTDFENKISMLSFKFDKIKEQDADYISQFCIKKQLEQKRSQLL